MAACALLAVSVRTAAGAEAPRGLKAWTKGLFSVQYRLVRDGDGARAEEVRVRVRQTVCYMEKPTDRLKDHERVHGLINDAEATRMEKELSAFRIEKTPLKAAERAFRDRFRDRVRQVDRLHRDWDANHTFPPGLPRGSRPPDGRPR